MSHFQMMQDASHFRGGYLLCSLCFCFTTYRVLVFRLVSDLLIHSGSKVKIASGTTAWSQIPSVSTGSSFQVYYYPLSLLSFPSSPCFIIALVFATLYVMPYCHLINLIPCLSLSLPQIFVTHVSDKEADIKLMQGTSHLQL